MKEPIYEFGALSLLLWNEHKASALKDIGI